MRRLALLALCLVLPVPGLALECHLGTVPVALSGYVEGRGIYAFDRDTPTENPSALFRISGKGTLGAWGACTLSLRGIHDGKIQDPEAGWPLSPLNKVYQDRDPSLRVDEAFIDLFTGKADFRVGIQKFAWGRLDEINPTDNLCPEDLTDPALFDESERKLGVPAVKANIYTDPANLEIAWIPRYVPYRLPYPDERWFPPVMRVPSTIATDTPIGDIPVTTAYRDIDLPSWSLKHSEFGLRCSKSIDDWEFSASYFTGYDPQPVYGAPTNLIISLPNPLSLKPEVTTEVQLEPRLYRMQVFGLDFSTTYQGFTFRGEGAFYKGKRYFRTLETVFAELATPEREDEIMDEFLKEFLSSGQTRQAFFFDPEVAVRKDAVKCGLGVDYIRGDTTISGQCILEHVLDYDTDQPIYFIKDGSDLTITLALKHFFLQNTLEVTLGGVYDPVFAYVVFQPTAVYSLTDSIKATFGAVVISGHDQESLMGQYRDNDEVFVKLRYSF